MMLEDFSTDELIVLWLCLREEEKMVETEMSLDETLKELYDSFIFSRQKKEINPARNEDCSTQ